MLLPPGFGSRQSQPACLEVDVFPQDRQDLADPKPGQCCDPDRGGKRQGFVPRGDLAPRQAFQTPKATAPGHAGSSRAFSMTRAELEN